MVRRHVNPIRAGSVPEVISRVTFRPRFIHAFKHFIGAAPYILRVISVTALIPEAPILFRRRYLNPVHSSISEIVRNVKFMKKTNIFSAILTLEKYYTTL